MRLTFDHNYVVYPDDDLAGRRAVQPTSSLIGEHADNYFDDLDGNGRAILKTQCNPLWDKHVARRHYPVRRLSTNPINWKWPLGQTEPVPAPSGRTEVFMQFLGAK